MPVYRLQYAKKNKARFLSHRELMTALKRALRRASFPLIYSKGYNPRPRFSFGPPLGVGVAGLREYMDMELIGDLHATGDYVERLNRRLLSGICAHCLIPVPPGDPGLGKLINCAHYLVRIPSAGRAADWEQLLKKIKDEGSWSYVRSHDQKAFDVSAGIIKSGVYDEGERFFLGFLMKVGLGEVPVRGLPDLITRVCTVPLQLSQITRTGLYRLENGCLIDPLGETVNLMKVEGKCRKKFIYM